MVSRRDVCSLIYLPNLMDGTGFVVVVGRFAAAASVMLACRPSVEQQQQDIMVPGAPGALAVPVRTASDDDDDKNDNSIIMCI